ncbi:MAG TPA: FecR domain-containing protein [Chitinophagaceae bacterium]|nr:FecR domain-containing protein [Chitinophagaceae bacterium]
MEENLVWKLIARKLSGEAKDEELVQLKNLLKEDSHVQATYEALSAFWSHPVKKRVEPDNLEEIFNTHFLSAIRTEEMTSSYPGEKSSLSIKKIAASRFWRVAAVIVGLIGLTTLAIYFAYTPVEASATKPASKELYTSNGTKTNTILPDGSKVWLNSGSKLTYKTFNKSQREVTLEGEAYFDIIKDAKRPFIVHTNVIDIKVLGTAFNVKSYDNEKTVEASLIRGLIEVTRVDNPGQKILLKPNEKITIFKKILPANEKTKKAVPGIEPVNVESVKISGFTYSKNDNSVIETSWTQNKLAFEEMPFANLALQLERWYGVKIIFTDEKAKNIVFSGSFVNETITEALEALKLNGDFDYKNNNNAIEIFIHK